MTITHLSECPSQNVFEICPEGCSDRHPPIKRLDSVIVMILRVICWLRDHDAGGCRGNTQCGGCFGSFLLHEKQTRLTLRSRWTSRDICMTLVLHTTLTDIIIALVVDTIASCAWVSNDKLAGLQLEHTAVHSSLIWIEQRRAQCDNVLRLVQRDMDVA